MGVGRNVVVVVVTELQRHLLWAAFLWHWVLHRGRWVTSLAS